MSKSLFFFQSAAMSRRARPSRAAYVFTSQFGKFARARLGPEHRVPILRPFRELGDQCITVDWGGPKPISVTICLSNSPRLPQKLGKIIDDIYVSNMIDALQLIREMSEAVQGSHGGSVIFREEDKREDDEEFEIDVLPHPDSPWGGL